MGSNPNVFIDEDLPCPVCKRSLSSPSPGSHAKGPLKSRSKKRAKVHPQYLLTNNQGKADVQNSLGKSAKEDEDIVVAQCGHLFHKFCLRHYCYLYREGQSNPMCRVSCPHCKRKISMMSAAAIEYKAHQEKTTYREKEHTQASAMHSELSGQVNNANQKLERLYEQVEEGGQNLEMFRSHMRKVKTDMKQIKIEQQKADNLKNELEHTDKMLAFMQSQHLKIVRKFIAKVKHKSPQNYIYFPRRLAPYLSLIEVDDRMVRDLGEIIVPIHLNNLKSDRQSLLKGILATAAEKLNAEQIAKDSSRRHKATEKYVKIQHEIAPPLQKIPPPRVIVKVRKSSVSILSSSVLTKDSIQKILRHVKHVPDKARKKICIEDPEGKKDVTLEGMVLNHLSSSSDVKVLFMPKKRHALQQYSEPCRSIEGCNSFQVHVPTRRCKSTDAVIVKTKKKANDDHKSRENPPKSKLPVERKRSSSIPNISRIKETIGKVEIVLLESKPEAPKCEIIVVEDNVPQQIEQEASPRPTSGDSTTKGEMGDINNNLLLDDFRANDISLPGSAKQIGAIVGQCEIDKNATVPITCTAPIACTSLLEMIYENLEEEKNFQTCKRSGGPAGWVGVGANGEKKENELQALTQECPSWSGQSPKFFRVDNKGIPRPEDPCYANFRQPTFLYSPPSYKEVSDFAVGYEESDEENQLRTYTTEERILIAAEREAALSEVKANFGSVSRRPICHGIPACLGMPDRQFRSQAVRLPDNTPEYLKKWQKQLSSSSSKKAASKPRLPASRISHTTDRPVAVALKSNPRPQNVYQQRQFSKKVREESYRNFLPPLTAFPSKRPSTAVCSKIADGGDQNRLGAEMILSGNFDDYFP